MLKQKISIYGLLISFFLNFQGQTCEFNFEDRSDHISSQHFVGTSKQLEYELLSSQDQRNNAELKDLQTPDTYYQKKSGLNFLYPFLRTRENPWRQQYIFNLLKNETCYDLMMADYLCSPEIRKAFADELMGEKQNKKVKKLNKEHQEF
ncbi:MAG: hypothetical protein ACRYGR_05005 [Janthinobacterium lividum]